MKFQDYLAQRGACTTAVEWVGRRGLRAAWRDCQRGDWLLWLIEREPRLVPVRALVEISLGMAEHVLPHVSPGEHWAREWLDAVTAYLAGASAFACGGAEWDPSLGSSNTSTWAMASAWQALEAARLVERGGSLRRTVLQVTSSAWSMERALVWSAPTDEMATEALLTGRAAQAKIIHRVAPAESLPRRLPSAKEVSSKGG